MSKKKYFLGRKHKQFYICYNNKTHKYEIKPIDENKEYFETLKIMIDDFYLFQGSYAECHAFQKGYQLCYITFKNYYKQNIDKVLKEISDKIFGSDIRMSEKE